ncbi:MAG: hypothetical protein HY054_14020, partial [Proteobacteria bacterium]|nr:hypothetical protein [Pseudomonadota bacterium]
MRVAAILTAILLLTAPPPQTAGAQTPAPQAEQAAPTLSHVAAARSALQALLVDTGAISEGTSAAFRTL